MNHANDNGLRFLSVCSGIEAASVAWGPLGWKAVAVSEIESGPCSVLKHHYPDVPNLGDMTKFKEWPDYGKDGKQPIDLLCGGTPCQSFSVAGLRSGLADPRGNLALTFLAIADRYKPKWIFWENVPGVLSSTSHVSADPCEPQDPVDMGLDGQEMETDDEYDAEEVHAFNSFLAGLSELGYGWAYVIRDAQYVRVDGFARAVPQRRRRVFVVGYFGDWRRAAAVLLEPESMCGNSPPRRQAGQNPSPTLSARTKSGGGLGTDFDLDGGLVASRDFTCAGCGEENSATWWPTCEWCGHEHSDDVSHPLLAKGNSSHDDSKETYVPVAFGGNNTSGPIDVATAVSAHGGPHGRQDFESETFVAHSLTGEGFDASEDGTGRVTPLVPVPYTLAIRGRGDSHNLEWRQDGTANTILTPNGGRGGIGVGAVATPVVGFSNRGIEDDGATETLRAASHGALPMVAFAQNQRDEVREMDIAGSLAAEPGMKQQTFLASEWAVRRLTPKECARLQGFPDDYLSQVMHNGKPLADGPMYKALGNSWPVNTVRWIGRRIQLVEEVARELANDNTPIKAAAA